MSKLLFHRPDTDLASPFDVAIVTVAKNNAIKIVSPYIGLGYFQRLLSQSASWLLISDLEAWLTSLASRDRTLAAQFIKENIDQIRHFPGIHAKTVVGPVTAYLGSANLTTAGIQTRTEMGVFVDDLAMVGDLHKWFDGLWKTASIPVMSEVLALAMELNERPNQSFRESKTPLSFGGEGVHARLMDLKVAREVEEKRGAPNVDIHLAKHDQISMAPLAYEKRKATSFQNYQPKDLEEAVRVLVEELAVDGFTLKELVSRVRQAGVKAKIKEIYLELVQYCGNLPRSVFAPDTVNRLLHDNSIFRQSSSTEIAPALSGFDVILMKLISTLSFDSADEISHIDLQLKHSSFLRWVLDLEQVGLVVEYIAPSNKAVARYKLNSKFTWSGRWRLFEVANQAWDEKLKLYKETLNDTSSNDFIAQTDEASLATDPLDALDKSIYPLQSLYARTPVTKKLPPMMATTVSTSNSPSNQALREFSYESEVLLNSRADKIYFRLFYILSKAKDFVYVPMGFMDIVKRISYESDEPHHLVFQVLHGNNPHLPKAANIKECGYACSVTINFNYINKYVKSNTFVHSVISKSVLGNSHPWAIMGKRGFRLPPPPKSDRMERVEAIKQEKKQKTSKKNNVEVKDSKKQILKTYLALKRDQKTVELDSINESATREPQTIENRDDMVAYMQRVANIFKG